MLARSDITISILLSAASGSSRETKLAVFQYIEGFYNPLRRHSR